VAGSHSGVLVSVGCAGLDGRQRFEQRERRGDLRICRRGGRLCGDVLVRLGELARVVRLELACAVNLAAELMQPCQVAP
jgi:hypothetical protein